LLYGNEIEVMCNILFLYVHSEPPGVFVKFGGLFLYVHSEPPGVFAKLGGLM
jgi:hypothetical protein